MLVGQHGTAVSYLELMRHFNNIQFALYEKE